MSDKRDRDEQAWQASAEAGRAEGDEAARYQRLFGALRAVDAPTPPADFAASLEQAVAVASPAGTDWEGAGVRAGLVALGVLALTAPLAGAWLFQAQVVRLLPAAPWPLLLAAAVGLLALAGWDRRAPLETAALAPT